MSDPSVSRIPPARCPYCDGKLDAAADMEASLDANERLAPKPGDLTVCIYCAQELVFDASLVPRKPAPGEVEALFAENPEFADEVRRLKRAVRFLDRRNAGGTA